MNTQNIKLFMALSIVLTLAVSAGTKFHRVVWDKDASTNAVIAFSPDTQSKNPYVRYGYTTDESTWYTKNPTTSRLFDYRLRSYFVRLENLHVDSAIYYRVCDQDGCGERFWFKTSPEDNTPFVVVAGGDTRTGWEIRQKGNKLISKIRPLFVMHGGDFTNANSASEMSSFLEDWALTYSDDTVDNITYKRIYPLLPSHGNHEDNNYKTLCEVFGTDFDNDGECTPHDTYGAVKISPLLRVYTLNSQFKHGGMSSYASAMNTWLAKDLSSSLNAEKWRFGQYHKPMFPHYTGKPDNDILFEWWANNFYDYHMNLVIESDTHISKITNIVKPSGDTFRTSLRGTMYVGEGSWGAPARSADNPKSWTMDLASIQQFKVIRVNTKSLDVRTAQFDESAGRLTRDERKNNPLVLPEGINWWSVDGAGESIHLSQDSNGHTTFDTNITMPKEKILTAEEDTFISSNQNNVNFNDSDEGLLADGHDYAYGQLMTLIKFSTSDMPECSVISKATLELNVFNPSWRSYKIFTGTHDWYENTATWNSVGGTQQKGNSIASFAPQSTGKKSVELNEAGVQAVNIWLSGGNKGIIIASGGTSDGVDIYSKEMGNGPKLRVEYTTENGCGQDNDDPVANAGEDKSVEVGQQIVLNGSGTDTDGSIVSYIWQEDGREIATSTHFTYTSAEVGRHILTLTVTDDDGAQASDTVVITVEPSSQAPKEKILTAEEDTFISSNQNNVNFNDSDEGLLADGHDYTYGQLMTLIKFSTSDMPECSVISKATLELNVFNPSWRSYKIFTGTHDWYENTATWNSVGGTQQKGNSIASFAPQSTGKKSVEFNEAGVQAVNIWLSGGNKGIIIASGGTSDGVDIYSKEMGNGPKLRVEYIIDCSK